VKESDLLGPKFVIQQSYNNWSAGQRQRMLAKEKGNIKLSQGRNLGKESATVNKGGTYLRLCSLEEHTPLRNSMPSLTKST
jgi:hypothetical protein